MKFAGAVIIGLAVVAAIAAVTFGIRWVMAGPNGKLQAREQIKSGPSRIAAYEHFFNLCAAVQSDEAALDAQLEQLVGTTGDERDRIRANIAGVTADRASAINEYNADARKSYTIGQFRASDLPYELPVAPHRKGDVLTPCVA